MTSTEDPPVVGLEDLLDDQEEADTRATARQWLLVVAGGAVGIAGLLGLLVATAPVVLELVDVIAQFTRALRGQ